MNNPSVTIAPVRHIKCVYTPLVPSCARKGSADRTQRYLYGFMMPFCVRMSANLHQLALPRGCNLRGHRVA
jgi:hypothetical protein